MRCNRFALACALSLWEASGFSPRFIKYQPAAGHHRSNVRYKESIVAQMASRKDSEYVDVKMGEISARFEREKKLAEIETRKQEILRQIELAEKERAQLLNEAKKASAAIEKTTKGTEGVIMAPTRKQNVENILESKPVPARTAEFKKTTIPENNGSYLLDMSSISGPASLFGGLVLAAAGVRVALENRDEKQGELRLKTKEGTKMNGTQSANSTETEDCTEVVSDFFLGKRVGNIGFSDTNSAEETQVTENDRKYTVINKSTQDEIIKIQQKNEREIAQAKIEDLSETNTTEDAISSAPATSSDTMVVEMDEETNVAFEDAIGLIPLEVVEVVNEAAENAIGPAPSKSSDTVVGIDEGVKGVAEDAIGLAPSKSSDAVVDIDVVMEEVKCVDRDKTKPEVVEEIVINKEKLVNVELDETVLDEKNATISNLRSSASSSGMFTDSFSPVPKAISEEKNVSCKIKVLAVGNGGASAIDRMIGAEQSKEVEFWAINTDLKALDASKQKGARTFAIGQSITNGDGANGDPKVGENAAKASSTEISAMIDDANVCIVKCGLGSGTGSGAAPVICNLAKESGALTIAVVTEPFPFEGKMRLKQAVEAIDRLFEAADTVIVISNSNVLEIIPEDTSLEMSFQVVDEFVNQVVIGLTNMLTRTGISTVDFAGVNGVLKKCGFAVVGMGTGSENTAAEDATVAALTSPLLDAPLDKARGVLVNVVGGKSLSLQKIDQALEIVNANFAEDCNIVVGAQVNEALPESTVSVTVIATSFDIGSDDDEEEEEEQ